MYIRVTSKKLKEIITEAIKKSGSYRKLSQKLKIPKSSLARYSNGDLIPEKRLNNILEFLNLKESSQFIIEKVDNNFKQKLGGVNCVLSKKKRGIFDSEMKKWQKFQADKLKKWHKMMKKEHPLEYYQIQYSRFKKIGEYKYTTKKGEKVRNSFEKETADILFNFNLDYVYEPLIKANNKYFFPDFLVEDKVIIECTTWRGCSKAYQLQEKIKYLGKKYQVFVVIPKTLYSYYKILNHHLILGLDEFVPVAQTFAKERSNR